MAVTQQLARIPAEYLASCRQSADASPDGDPRWDPPSADALDLDWAPFLLERVCELGGLDDVHRSGLRQALDGDTAINLAFLNTQPHAIGPFGPDPTALSAAQVVRAAELLGQIDFPALLAALPTDEAEAASLSATARTRSSVARGSTCWGTSTPCASSIVVHPNGSFSSCSGGTDPDRLTVGSRQQLGNYVNC